MSHTIDLGPDDYPKECLCCGGEMTWRDVISFPVVVSADPLVLRDVLFPGLECACGHKTLPGRGVAKFMERVKELLGEI